MPQGIEYNSLQRTLIFDLSKTLSTMMALNIISWSFFKNTLLLGPLSYELRVQCSGEEKTVYSPYSAYIICMSEGDKEKLRSIAGKYGLQFDRNINVSKGGCTTMNQLHISFNITQERGYATKVELR